MKYTGHANARVNHYNNIFLIFNNYFLQTTINDKTLENWFTNLEQTPVTHSQQLSTSYPHDLLRDSRKTNYERMTDKIIQEFLQDFLAEQNLTRPKDDL